MKRNKPIERRKRLEQKTPLKRAGFARKPPETPGNAVPGPSAKPADRPKPMKQVSDKAKSFKPLDDMARAICKRVGVCEAQGVLPGACSGPLEWAHMIRRDQIASRWRQDNCKCLCKAHHGAVTSKADLWFMLFSETHYYAIKELSMGMPTAQFVEAEKHRLQALTK